MYLLRFFGFAFLSVFQGANTALGFKGAHEIGVGFKSASKANIRDRPIRFCKHARGIFDAKFDEVIFKGLIGRFFEHLPTLFGSGFAA